MYLFFTCETNMFSKLSKVVIFPFYFLFFYRCLICVDIGSDSFVDRFTSQQSLNNGDRIAGFACLLGGFKLNNSSVSATFDSFFPVIGDIELEGGTLSLSRDFILHDVSAIKTLGNINGSNYIIELPSSIKILPEQSIETSSCGAEVCNVSYVTDCLQFNYVQCCDWSYDDKFIAVGMASCAGNHTLKIYEFDGATLTFKDSESLDYYSVESLSWHPSSNLLAVGRDYAGVGNKELLIYEVNQTTGALTFVSGVDVNATPCAFDWHPTANWLAVSQDKSGQDLAIYRVDSQGNITTNPIAEYDADEYPRDRTLAWNNSGEYLAIGLLSTAANELLIFSFNPDTEILSLDCSKNLGYTVSGVSWSKVSPNFLAIGVEVVCGEMLKIYEFDSSSSTLTQRAAKSDLGDYVYTVDWHPSSNCLAVGRDYVPIGHDFRIYYFNPEDYSLEEITGFSLPNDVRSLKWSKNGSYITHGCDNYKFYVYSASNCDNEVFANFEFTDLNIFLNGDVSLNSSKITFAGESLISGKGNTLDLSGTSTIVVGSNASLCLKDISIEGLTEASIYCTDNTSTLSVDNCKWIMGNDYIFEAGHLEILNDFYIIGDGYNFVYQTDQQSVVSSNSRIILDANVTFSYAPLVENRDLISLYDDTSDFILRGATLFSTTTGLRLTKGNLIVERKSFVSCDGTKHAESVCFGDGASALNDLNIETVGAANLEILNGYIVYDNVSG